MLKNIINKIILIIAIFVGTLLVTTNVNASDDVTKKLYQDITINKDGSITVIESALLDGEYNGREREIEFKNTSATTFTGVYSNFTGNTDIYNGTSIKDIEIYDISQNNFNTIYDLSKKEETYKKVNSASKGKYGVFTSDLYSYGIDFKIFCPSKKKKVFMMKYTITDVVVIHNDVAELYWNVMGEDYREKIEDFQVLVHLPGEDNDLRVWTHGPLTGENKIVDSKTIYFKDTNISKYTAETIRIMFDKTLVPEATKKSNVNGKENILKYEQSMADVANAEREKNKLNKLNKLEEYILDLEEDQYIFYYNRALELVNELSDEIDKTEYLARIEKYKDAVNEDWKEDIQDDIEFMTDDKYEFLSKYRLKRLKEYIEEGFDEKSKQEFLEEVEVLENILEQKYERIRTIYTYIVIIMFILVTVYIIFKLVKLAEERNKYKGKYYREFPSEDNPYVLEYLMKRKITNLSFSATILSLVAKKVIKLDKVAGSKKDDIQFILIKEDYSGTNAEIVVLNILFDLVGTNNKCNLEDLKNYGKTEYKAKTLTKKIKKFKDEAEKEAKYKNYFKTYTLIVEKIIIIALGVIALFMAIGVFYQLDDAVTEILQYLFAVSGITIIYFLIVNKDKNRNSIGKVEYSKWLAHKRYLKHFSKFDEKDLPEIILWEKYLVTATILGCADKVQDKLKMYINNIDTDDNYLLLQTSLNRNLIRTINNSVNSSVSTANLTISSSSSSGGGYGGGSSFGGGGGGRRRRWRPFLGLTIIAQVIK